MYGALLGPSRRVSSATSEKKPMYALSFDGVDDYVDTNVSRIEYPGGSVGLFADSSEQWTIEFDVLVLGQGRNTFVAKSGSSTELNHVVLVGTHPSSDYMRYQLRGSGHNVTNFGAKDGRWKKLALTWDGAEAFLWEPGVRSAGLVNIGTRADTSASIRFGASIGQWFLHGMMRNVRIWNRPLTLGEMMQYRNVRLRGDEPGLLSYWPMDEGQGDVAFDHGPFGHHAFINGATWVEV